jgi:5-methylthioribose kinase
MIFAYANALVTMEDGAEKTKYLDWVLSVIEQFCDSFRAKADAMIAEKSTDRMMRNAGFRDAYIADIFRDQAGFAGTELIRRIVGTSKVKDITSIEDAAARAKAEMLCLKAGIAFVKEPEKMAAGRDYAEFLRNITEAGWPRL